MQTKVDADQLTELEKFLASEAAKKDLVAAP
jgi:hypothetical protein